MDELEGNRLREAASPYLQQHADNPVHWMEWGEDAFRLARERDAPVFLSIGYAACHWCHVMAHESFEDEAVAAVLNRDFVSVKVDREERPDVDQIYMNALHALGEQGGWPLSMFLDPEGRPFWGGTYFPPEAKYGRPSFRDALGAVRKTWDTDRSRIEHNASGLTRHLRKSAAVDGTAEVDRERLDAYAEAILSLVDRTHGGIGGAPKFPNAPMMEVLWRAWHRTGDERYREAFTLSLRRMALGGVYDHVGGGLHRYAVDAHWLVPHFEKMLYDQAHFVEQCGWAFAATGDALFADRVRRTVDWLRREMTTRTGFAASLDADTPTAHGGEEGLTYTWTPDELRAVLGEDAQAVAAAYDLAAPNFEGRAIPNRIGHEGDPAEAVHRDALLAARSERTQPARDDKVLTDWNMSFVAAWTRAARLLGDADWIEGATAVTNAVLGNDPATLHHSRLDADGRSGVVRPALLSDHAEAMHALLALYGASARPSLLSRVHAHMHEVATHYLADGIPVLTHDGADALIVRPSAFSDGPDPSPASRLMQVLVVLDALGEDTPAGMKSGLESALAAHLDGASYGNAGAANALDHALNVATLVLVGAPDEWECLAHAKGDPNLFVLRAATFDDLPANHAARTLAETSVPVAILCRHRSCFPPVRTVDDLRTLLA